MPAATDIGFAWSCALPDSGRTPATRWPTPCLDGVDPRELIDAPVNYFDMLHDDFKSSPAEIRHL